MPIMATTPAAAPASPATAPIFIPKANEIEQALEPWERIAWTKQQEQAIYRNWGIFFYQQQLNDTALKYYDKSLELNEKDALALYLRSSCKLDLAKAETALKDAFKADELLPELPRNGLAIAGAFYSLNEFENAKVTLHQNTGKFSGAVLRKFRNQIDKIDENLKDSLGDSLTLFFQKNESRIADVYEKIKQSKYIDKRPLWKSLKDEEKCDVLSVLEKEEELISPLELARRKLCLKVFNQIYLERSWKDVLYMHEMWHHKMWFMPSFRLSAPLLHDLVSTKYVVVKKLIKMMHARSPMYNEWKRKFPNRKLRQKHHEIYLNCVQNSTRRNMFNILRKIKKYRIEGKTEELATYIEEIMGDFVMVKTQRVMPWKFEFINEVYNTYALTLADQYAIEVTTTISVTDVTAIGHVCSLLNIHNETRERPMGFVFGNRATSLAAIKTDQKFYAYKKFIGRLEKRMKFAKYSIEKCYFWHEIANAHFKNSHHNECYIAARRGIDETRFCNNNLWAFLCQMLIVKSHASLHKIEHCKDALQEAHGWAIALGNEKIIHFVETILSINEGYIELKKKSRSQDSIRRRRLSVINVEDSTDEFSKQTSVEMQI